MCGTSLGRAPVFRCGLDLLPGLQSAAKAEGTPCFFPSELGPTPCAPRGPLQSGYASACVWAGLRHSGRGGPSRLQRQSERSTRLPDCCFPDSSHFRRWCELAPPHGLRVLASHPTWLEFFAIYEDCFSRLERMLTLPLRLQRAPVMVFFKFSKRRLFIIPRGFFKFDSCSSLYFRHVSPQPRKQGWVQSGCPLRVTVTNQ